MCINYRALNMITVKNGYPFPRIDDFLDHMHHAKSFTKLDLKSGYHHIQVKEEDTWNINFKTRKVIYNG